MLYFILKVEVKPQLSKAALTAEAKSIVGHLLFKLGNKLKNKTLCRKVFG